MKSMTGFGRAKLEINNKIYNVEIKSVNHKYTDISVKMPRALTYLEEKVKKELLKEVSRGKIDVYVNFENYGDEGKEILINKQIANKYIEELKNIAEENGLSTQNIQITDITKMPDVLNIKMVEDEKQEEELLQVTREAISNFVQMREQEGKNIKNDLVKRIDNIETEVNSISSYSTRLIEEYVVKLGDRIKEILKTDIVDENRLAMETVIYADKSSVKEEITRLESHIKQFRELIDVEDVAIGKKLDFLIQEMNRETNTIGSKSGSLDITNIVINIKTELEDIREQIQNIE